MLVIDSQVHPYALDTPDRPWVTPYDDRPSATGDEQVAAMDAVGVDGAIAVTAGRYGLDPSYVVEVQRAHPDRFAIVMQVDSKDPAVAEVMADWKKTPGAVAVRLKIGIKSGGDPKTPGVDIVLRAAARLGLCVNFSCGGNVDAATGLIDRYAETQCVIDHLGFSQPKKNWADLPKILELAKRPNAAIKVSGACSMSCQPYPYDDIWEPLQRVFDAWGFDRCLWGTDWTRTFALFPYMNAVVPFLTNKCLSESERAMLMGGACAKIYGWTPKSTRKQRHPAGSFE